MDQTVLGRISPRQVALFIPPNLKKVKLLLFERMARHITGLGGRVVRYNFAEIGKLPDEIIPIVGCTPEFREFIADWRRRGRTWIYWDRGYLRRVYATWLPKGSGIGIPMGYYRWHINTPQMDQVFAVPSDRFDSLRLTDKCEAGNQIKPWNRDGDHIVIADTLPDYWKLFSDGEWTRRTMKTLQRYTARRIVIRDKESKVPLYDDLRNAHCLVAHGSIAAVESVVMGCPVFVDAMSAAALVGSTELSKVETPVYPERMPWLHSLAYCQFTEEEIVDGTLWRLLR